MYFNYDQTSNSSNLAIKRAIVREIWKGDFNLANNKQQNYQSTLTIFLYAGGE